MRHIQPRLTTETLATLLILSAWQSPDLQAQVPLTNVIDVAAGDAHACALKADGGVVCWGNNDFGQLGNGTTTSSPIGVPVNDLSDVSAIAAGSGHTCALTHAGSLFCWGENARGQLGDGTTTTRLTPAAVSGLGASASALTAGGLHTCTITGTGAAKCWGDNSSGQLGDGTTTQRWMPAVVFGLGSNVGDLSAGASHICAVRASNGRTFCWGLNNDGQLGDGTTINRLTPTDVIAPTVVASVHAGYRHSCLVDNGGTAACWGDNFYGQLGDGTEEDRLTPSIVHGVSSGARSLELSDLSTCMRRNSGVLSCWGLNDEGQLGDGTNTFFRPYPGGVQIGTTDALDSGAYFSCAVTAGDHRVMCWGSNDYGQLGDGTTEDRFLPVPTLQVSPPPEVFTNGFE